MYNIQSAITPRTSPEKAYALPGRYHPSSNPVALESFDNFGLKSVSRAGVGQRGGIVHLH